MLSQDYFEPGRRIALRFHGGAGPQRETLPLDVFLVGLVEAILGNLHQLPVGSSASNLPDSTFKLAELFCRHLLICTLH